MPTNADLYDDNEYEDDGDNQTPTPKDLRAALKKANDKSARLEAQVAELTKANTANKLNDIMRDKKVPANIQRWMKRDEVEATPEAVQKWLDENGSDFGWKPGGDESGEEPGEKEPQQESKQEEAPVNQGVLTEEDIAAYIRFQQMGQAPSDMPAVDPVKAAVDRVAGNIDIKTPYEQVVRALKATGVPIGGDIEVV